MIYSKSLLISMIFVLTMSIASCQTKKDSATRNAADKEKQLSIVRKLFWDSLPNPKGYVNDYENIFTHAEEKSLDSLIRDFDNKTTIQIAIVTFDTTMTTKDSLEALTLRLAKFWGVGQKGKDNGILIGICTGYRLMRIQNGRGIEKMLSNSETKQLMDTAFFPGFREQKYYEATLNGLKVLMAKLVGPSD